MPTDAFELHQTGLSSPPERHYAITPNDAEDLPRVPRVIYCEAAGTVVVRDKHGTELSYTLVQGQELVFRGVRIMATGTTATVYGQE